MTEPDNAPKANNWAVAVVVVLWIGVAAALTSTIWNGYPDIVLTITGTESTGRITHVEETKPLLWFREGNYRVDYYFTTRNGRTIYGGDILPPSKRPTRPTLEVRYWLSHPEVNRIKSQVSPTPFKAILLWAIWIFGPGYYLVADFLRKRRRQLPEPEPITPGDPPETE